MPDIVYCAKTGQVVRVRCCDDCTCMAEHDGKSFRLEPIVHQTASVGVTLRDDGEEPWDADDIIARVREDLKQRSEFGIKKYGRPLASRHDIELSGWINHMYEELLDAANYAKCMWAYGVGYFRTARQKALYEHGKAGFGVEHADPVSRAIRMLEEVAECVQAAGVPIDKVQDIIAYVYRRPKGDVATEIGQVGVTLCMLAESLGIDAEAEEAAETERFLARTVESMQARLREKLAGGMPVVDV